jgi:prepilin-type N-terminal cleavage/methylation domain-containing protein/prepilin-type processing-associated H-X9-DG protein
MKTLPSKAKISGFTLVELLLVIFVIAVLAAMLLPVLSGNHKGAPQSVCLMNLKQIDVEYLMWADDHGGKFPAQVPLADKGAMEFVSTGYASLQFRMLSKYLRYPYFFICPADKSKHTATNCEVLRDENLSYFINVDVTTNNPSKSILAGDRNLLSDGQPVQPGLFELTTNLNLNWSGELHLHGGNLAFADGHVEWNRTGGFKAIIQEQPLTTNRFAIP